MRKLALAVAFVMAPTLAQAAIGKELSDNDARWRQFAYYAIKKSKDQFGYSTYQRFCEPKVVLCTEFVFYRAENNKGIYLRETYNAGQSLVRREVCTVNEQNDVRECVNFDTKEFTLDMKDETGWHRAASNEVNGK